VLINDIPDLELRTIREAEFACNSLIGFNFGDGHLHNEELINAVQSRCGFEPGEFVVCWVESQAIHSDVQHYKLIDAARCHRAGHLEGSRRGHRAALAAQRPHPDSGDLASRGRQPGSRPARGRHRCEDACMSTAVVVGGGPNGLAAAALLAEEGVQVTLLEAANEIGGGTRSAEGIVPGLLHDHCSAIHPWPWVPRPCSPSISAGTAWSGGGPRSTACIPSTAETPACCTGQWTRLPPGSVPTPADGGPCSLVR
jgi:hypothetical protein